MRIGLLYSGGKDSSLAAYLLDRLGFDVHLITISFGINKDYRHAQESAEALGFKHEILRMEKDVLDEAIDLLKKDGYPRYAINHIHFRSLEEASKKYQVISDGTRRDDKTPNLSLTQYRALEDGNGVEYLSILRGFGHKSIKRLCSELFVIEEGESSKINKGDYEGELRTYVEGYGFDVKKIFPPHHQTRVISWRFE